MMMMKTKFPKPRRTMTRSMKSLALLVLWTASMHTWPSRMLLQVRAAVCLTCRPCDSTCFPCSLPAEEWSRVSSCHDVPECRAANVVDGSDGYCGEKRRRRTDCGIIGCYVAHPFIFPERYIVPSHFALFFTADHKCYYGL